MKCPYCRHLDNRVIDSRLGKEGDIIRRRRECEACERRFTTYERVEEALPLVVKKDGRREPYDRSKVEGGIEKACEKRPVSAESRVAIADRIERMVQELGEKEVSSSVVGEAMMRELYDLDKVAYVRFASVYRSFRDIDEFMRELEDLVRSRRAMTGGRRKTSRSDEVRKASKARKKPR